MGNSRSSSDRPGGQRKRTAAAEVERLNRELADRTAEFERVNSELKVHQIELEMQNEELRHAQVEIRELYEKYQDLYDFAPVCYLTLDCEGRIRAANLAAAALLGVGRGALLKSAFKSFLTTSSGKAFTDFIGEVLTSSGKRTCEVETLRREGVTTHALIEGIAAATQDTGKVEVRIALVDITERKRAEATIDSLNAELAARAAELERANMDLEAFNYTVAHDLRKPLTVVNLLCQTLKELCGGLVTEQCADYIRQAYDGTVRMNRLIEALLNFSGLNRVELRRETVDLSATARTAAAELKLSDPARLVTFRVADGITVRGDPALLRTVLENLLGNAWKFTSGRTEGVIEFGSVKVGGDPAFYVRDNGAGFDPAVAERIFLPFQKLPGSEELKGFGIGLATVERIIHRHGGRVWAAGEPDRGAAFYFTLPLPGTTGGTTAENGD